MTSSSLSSRLHRKDFVSYSPPILMPITYDNNRPNCAMQSRTVDTASLDSFPCEYSSTKAKMESKEGKFERSDSSELAISCRMAEYVFWRKTRRVNECVDWRHSCLMRDPGSTVWSPKRTNLPVVVIAEKAEESGEMVRSSEGVFRSSTRLYKIGRFEHEMRTKADMIKIIGHATNGFNLIVWDMQEKCLARQRAAHQRHIHELPGIHPEACHRIVFHHMEIRPSQRKGTRLSEILYNISDSLRYATWLTERSESGTIGSPDIKSRRT